MRFLVLALAFFASSAHADAIERLAGTRYQAWEEVFGLCLEAAESELSTEAQHDLFAHMARWYAEKVSRPDLALPWLQKVLQIEPSHERSLEMLTQIYRKAQQWAEQDIRINAIGPRDMTEAPGAAISSGPELASLALVLASSKGRRLSGLVFDADRCC